MVPWWPLWNIDSHVIHILKQLSEPNRRWWDSRAWTSDMLMGSCKVLEASNHIDRHSVCSASGQSPRFQLWIKSPAFWLFWNALGMPVIETSHRDNNPRHGQDNGTALFPKEQNVFPSLKLALATSLSLPPVCCNCQGHLSSCLHCCVFLAQFGFFPPLSLAPFGSRISTTTMRHPPAMEELDWALLAP